MIIATNPQNDLSNVGIHPTPYRLPSAARVGRVRLAVSNLGRSVEFYIAVIGLQEVGRYEQTVQLAAQGPADVLLELEHLPGVEAIGRRSRLGLYHTAFLLPAREDLSSFVQHLQHVGVPFGAADHLYSEALYLTDPDGLSVEVYADRPKDQWTIVNREIVSATDPVHFESFPLVAADSWRGAPAGTTMGHVHFYVGDLNEAKKFYHTGLGLDITTWRYPGALFTSAGGYHHHVGLNVWAAGSPMAAKTDTRLLFWELVLPTSGDVQRAADSVAAGGFRVTSDEPNVRVMGHHPPADHSQGQLNLCSTKSRRPICSTPSPKLRPLRCSPFSCPSWRKHPATPSTRLTPPSSSASGIWRSRQFTVTSP